MKAGRKIKTVGIIILSFGVGILASFFLPEAVLVVIEALVIISVGLLWLCGKERRSGRAPWVEEPEKACVVR